MIGQPPPMILVPWGSVCRGLSTACPWCHGEICPVFGESGVPLAIAEASSLHWLDPSPESIDRKHVLFYAERHQCRGAMIRGITR